MGKSNISDAILLVLGPTSSKALRAERLTHLFFNGGASKKPASDCEVSLVFDNHDHLLPVESEEVEVTLYVKLAPSDPNGYYSYFYVNGRRTTQGEIDSLLAHARLSGDGYNLVQQGDVNKIVAMGPIPRRGLVERLAGISQYDDELQKAEAKRADLETNLGRINTLLTEVKSHLAALESQRLQAIQYRQLQDQKHVAEARLARAGHRLAAQEVASGEAQLKNITTELEKLRGEAVQLSKEQDELVASINAVEREIARRGGPEAARFKTELDEKRLAFARLDAGLTQANEVITELEARISSLAEQVKADEKEIGRLAKTEVAAQSALKAAEAKVHANADEVSAATGDAEQSQGKLAGTRKQIVVLQRQQEEGEASWQTAVRTQEEAKAGLDSADRDQAQAEDDHRTRELELRDLELRARPSKSESGTGSNSTSQLQDQLFKVRAKEKTVTAEAQRLAQEVNEANRQVHCARRPVEKPDRRWPRARDARGRRFPPLPA